MIKINEKKHYKLTDDLREAIGYNYAKTAESCDIAIDNSVANDSYGDVAIPLISLIDSNFENVTLDIAIEHFILCSNNEQIMKIPLSVISDINYLEDDNCFYLFFSVDKTYDIEMRFNDIY